MKREYIEVQFGPHANHRTYFVVYNQESFSFIDPMERRKTARYCISAAPPTADTMDILLYWIESEKTLKFLEKTATYNIEYIHGNLPTTVLNEMWRVEDIIENHFLRIHSIP